MEQIQDLRLQRHIRGHVRESFELNGYAVSLDMPLRDGRWKDVLPDSAALWA